MPVHRHFISEIGGAYLFQLFSPVPGDREGSAWINCLQITEVFLLVTGGGIGAASAALLTMRAIDPEIRIETITRTCIASMLLIATSTFMNWRKRILQARG